MVLIRLCLVQLALVERVILHLLEHIIQFFIDVLRGHELFVGVRFQIGKHQTIHLLDTLQ